MTTKTLLLVMLAIMMHACNIANKPKAEIERDVFVDLLVDIHLADGYLNTQGYRTDVERDKITQGYIFVLKKHKVSPRQFMATMKYYSENTKAYDEVYNKVIEKLTKLQSEHSPTKISNEIKPGS